MGRNPAWNRSVLLLAIAVAAYFQTWSDLWPHWMEKDATYTHGVLVAAMSLWLVWRARSPLAAIEPVATLSVLPLTLVLSAAWLVAARANVFILHAVLWPLLAFSILWAGVGWRAASRLAFPLGFLYFAIPVWELLKPPLQAISAFMVGRLTQAIGVPGQVEGPYVMLPDATIFIALDCSGAHFLSVALAVGAVAIVNRGDNWRTGILIMALAAVLSMIFNWLRILLIVLAYLHPDLKHSLETMGHLTFGWWVFAVDLLAFVLVLRFVPASAPRVPAAEPAPEAREPNTREPNTSRLGVRGYAVAAATALLLPLSSIAGHLRASFPADVESPPPIAGLTGPSAPDPRWKPRAEGAAWSHRAAYLTPDGRVVELYRNEYHRQSQGSELISRGSPLFEPTSYTIGASNTAVLGASEDKLEVTSVTLRDRSGKEWSALYTYIVDDEVVASARRAQLLMALHSFYGRPAAGVLAVMMPCVPNCGSIRTHLETAMQAAHEAYRRARSN